MLQIIANYPRVVKRNTGAAHRYTYWHGLALVLPALGPVLRLMEMSKLSWLAL